MAERVVVVTGSTSGIGIAVARRFALDGEHVVLHGRSEARGEAVRDALLALGTAASVRLVLADVARADDCERLIAEAAAPLDRIDVLVNNAGTDIFTGVLDTTVEGWGAAMDLLLRSAWLCAKHAAPLMPPGSAIVNVGSNHATTTMPGAFPYNVAKAGLVALTQSLALELAPRGIRANCLNPGYIDTPLNDLWFDEFPDPAAEREAVRRLHPVGRIGTVEDCAWAVRFLASGSESGFITGTTLLADGGRSTRMEDPR
jgi:NAD(P)-dependent dehydrogenase (short-subunit alcohol dehydrogenase family)